MGRKSLGDGYIVEVVSQMADGSWLVRFDDSAGVSVALDEAELLDSTMYVRLKNEGV